MPKWKKGDPSPNPKGRPRGLVNWHQAFKDKGAELHPSDSNGRTWYERVVEGVYRIAAGRPSARQLKAAEIIFDRILGKPVQSVFNANVDLTREQRTARLKELLETFPGLPESQNDEHSNSKPS